MAAEERQRNLRAGSIPGRAPGLPPVVLPYRTAEPSVQLRWAVGPVLLGCSVLLLAGAAWLLYSVTAKSWGGGSIGSGWIWQTADSRANAGPLRRWAAAVGLSGLMRGNRPEMVRAAVGVLLAGAALWQAVDAVRLMLQPPSGPPWSVGVVPLWAVRRFAQAFHAAVLLGAFGGMYLDVTAKAQPPLPPVVHRAQPDFMGDFRAVPEPVWVGAWVLVAAANLAVLRSPSRAFRVTVLVLDVALLAWVGLTAASEDTHALLRAAATVAAIGLAVSLLAVAADPWTESRRRAKAQELAEVGEDTGRATRYWWHRTAGSRPAIRTPKP